MPFGSDFPDNIPILIAGAGPVGLALASDLGWRGISCLVIEQGDGTIDHPRANAENARTMEFCRRWGIADKVRTSGTPENFPHTVLYLTSMNGYEVVRIDRPGHGGGRPSGFSPERPQRCNQLWFDPILRELAESFPTVNLKYQCRLESYKQDDNGVVATVVDSVSGEKREIACQYLVDCCGGASPVRRALGIRMDGKPVVEYNVNLFYRIPNFPTLHDKGDAAMLFMLDETGVWASLVELNGADLWRIGLRGKDIYEHPETIDTKETLRRVIGKDVPHELLSAKPWIARDLVAESYGSGRVFLAGDAAHLNTPSGGFGMNTGLGDAVDIGWKLAAMVQGWGGPKLMATYEAERQPVAVRNVRQATHNFEMAIATETGPDINDPGAAGEAARKKVGDWIRSSRTRTFITDGTALGYVYESSIVVPDGTPPQEDTIIQYHPSSRPGGRAPHAWLADGRSTLDLFGKGFTLLDFAEGSAAMRDELKAAFASRQVPLEVVSIDDPEIAKLYESPLVLVRPDGHVAWRSTPDTIGAEAIVDQVRGAA